MRKERAEKIFAPEAPGREAHPGRHRPRALFTQLTVQSKGVTVTMERHGTTWRITSPV